MYNYIIMVVLKKICRRIRHYLCIVYNRFVLCYKHIYKLLLIKRNKIIGNTKTIHIAFIVQMPAVWDKVQNVFEMFNTYKNVNVELLQVPEFDIENCQLTSQFCSYYKNKYPKTKITKVGDGTNIKIKLRKANFDYIFYERPYSHFLPKSLWPSFLYPYTKLCYIPYGYSGSDIFISKTNSIDFIKYLTFYFTLSDSNKRSLLEFINNTERAYSRFVSLGYPNLENYLQLNTHFKDSTCNKSVILWTPRFTYDKSVGGSHFFEYKDDIINEKLLDKIKLVFRPHPLMFETFIRDNLMKRSDVDEILKKLSDFHVVYDNQRPIYDSIVHSNILITDYSSILINYFLTGKPIIYCPSKYRLNSDFSKILNCIYVANNSKELKGHIDNLLKGNDYLKSKRQELINSDFVYHKGSTKRIVDYILEDYDKTYKLKGRLRNG